MRKRKEIHSNVRLSFKESLIFMRGICKLKAISRSCRYLYFFFHKFCNYGNDLPAFNLFKKPRKATESSVYSNLNTVVTSNDAFDIRIMHRIVMILHLTGLIR